MAIPLLFSWAKMAEKLQEVHQSSHHHFIDHFYAHQYHLFSLISQILMRVFAQRDPQ